jgi:iron complex outermembrane receptor protein/hemoglobin/transferrin/lactoferrin receptor protein
MISGAGFHLGCVMSWLLAADAGDTDKPAEFEAVVTAPRDAAEELDEERATSSVSRRDIDRRLPRSAPDALRYEPGVFVQQSAHGQGSAFIRGLTGQQTLLLFDGIRMNNSTYRQGPNQYFFTLDPHTVRSIEVLRGGGSTRWGSDALGGVIDAHPIEPSLVRRGFGVEPKLSAKAATADSDRGGRFQTDASWATPLGVDVGFVGGLGARRVGLLKGPPVLNPDATTDIGHLPWVPRYEEYDPTLPFAEQPTLRTQLGTGFDELTGDGRFVLRLSPEQRLTLAGYLYREYNAPRTDQCPPPTAPFDQCLTYAQQFRHLAYAAWDARLGRMVDEVRATFSWQQQHERRRLDLTAANLLGRGIDDVHTWGVTARATTKHLTLSDSFGLGMELGADTYLDWVR